MKNFKWVPLTPTISTSAFADGQQMGAAPIEIDAMDELNGSGIIRHVSVVDKEKIKGVFDILFFSSSPTLTSVQLGALDISDAEMAAKFLGRVKIESGDWQDLNVNSYAHKADLGIHVKALGATLASSKIYAVLMARGAIDYAATTPLVIRIGIEQD